MASLATSVLAILLAVLCVLYVTQLSGDGAEPALRWAIAALAAAIIGIRLVRRRSSR